MWHLSAQKESVRRQTQPLLSATRCHVPTGTATAPLPIAARQSQHCHNPPLLPVPTSLSLQSSSSPRRLCPPLPSLLWESRTHFQAICRKPAHSQQSPQQPCIQNNGDATSLRPPQALQLPPTRWKVQSQLSLDPTQSAVCSPSSFMQLNLLA